VSTKPRVIIAGGAQSPTSAIIAVHISQGDLCGWWYSDSKYSVDVK